MANKNEDIKELIKNNIKPPPTFIDRDFEVR
jgi:hypothetical protein